MGIRTFDFVTKTEFLIKCFGVITCTALLRYLMKSGDHVRSFLSFIIIFISLTTNTFLLCSYSIDMWKTFL